MAHNGHLLLVSLVLHGAQWQQENATLALRVLYTHEPHRETLERAADELHGFFDDLKKVYRLFGRLVVG